MWFKLQNELINLNSVRNFIFDETNLRFKITFINGESKIFKYNIWSEFNSTKNSILNSCGLKPLKNGKLFPKDYQKLISYN